MDYKGANRSISWVDVDNLMKELGLSSNVGVDYRTLEDFESFGNIGYRLQVSADNHYSVHFQGMPKWDGTSEITIVSIYFSENVCDVISSAKFYLDPVDWKDELEKAMRSFFCSKDYWNVLKCEEK